MVKLSILGPTKLRREDGGLDHSFITDSKRLALLTYLMLANPRSGFHKRDSLIALFWSEKEQKKCKERT